MAQRRRTYARSLFAAAIIGTAIGSVNGFRFHSVAQINRIDGVVGEGGSNTTLQTSSTKSSSATNKSSPSSKSKAPGSTTDTTETDRTQNTSNSQENVWSPTSTQLSDEERRQLEEKERFRREEEDRRRAEEEWKRQEEEKQRIFAEAIERLHQEEVIRQQKIEKARYNALQTPVGSDQVLGCTDAKGLWTTDRSECTYHELVRPDPAYVDPQVEQAKQEEIRRKMMDRYVADEQSAQKQFLIASLIGETLERLVAVRDANLLSSPEQQQFVDESIQWLRGGQEYFSVPGRSDDEVAQMSGYIRQIVDYAQQVTDEARKARIAATGSLPEIGAIFGRTEKMLNVFPDVLAVLSTEGIDINQDVISAYGAIATRFAEIRSACILDSKVCGQLGEVLGGLEQLQAYVLSTINAAGKPDVETLINEVVQARMKQ